MLVTRICLALLLLATPVRSEVPRVATDIAPVHSLVAMVMVGLGTPDLIVTPGASPHGVSLRPSQARALQSADLVVWVGPELTPWLVRPLDRLAPGADKLALLQVPGTQLLTYRHDDDAPDDAPEEDHDHGSGADPHAWLDPENARVWLAAIAGRLAGIDPANGDTYRANALAGQARLAQLQLDMAAMLAPMQGHPYVTFHDAYQYFESRFGLTPTGAVRAGDATAPGPAGLARLRDELARAGVTCAFSEPQFDPGLLRAAMGHQVLKIIPLDPMGRDLVQGPDLYPGLMRDMARAFASCADPG